MDTFVMEIVVALVALSFIPPDWEKHEEASWLQVYAMSFGLFAIGVYVVARPWLQ